MELNDYVFNGGVAGGIIMACPECGKEHVRNAVLALEIGHPEYCVWCDTVELRPLLKKKRRGFMENQIASHGSARGNRDDVEYDDFLARIQDRFDKNTGLEIPIFTTDAEGLWAAYLDSFEGDDRQHHNCRACRQFIERFGSLVTIDEVGRTSSVFWNEEDAPERYKPAVRAMARAARRSHVNGVFSSQNTVWGNPATGIWRHFAVTPPRAMARLGADRKMVGKREDYRTLQRAMAELTLPVIKQALVLLQTDALYRSEKAIGQAQWLYALHLVRSGVKGEARDNLTWKAVATAPAGFCHPRSSMIGTLLDDITAGLDFSEVSRRFADKMHPLQYQRPQVAPTAGNIAAAEKLVEKLGIAASLRRRFARIDEIETLWKPEPPKDEPQGGGVFGRVKAKSVAPPIDGTDMPGVTMTWDKFARTVLPYALEIECYVHRYKDNYIALVTAEDPAAPPILQWDSEECRNPVSSYVWNGGSPPEQWGLFPGKFHRVSAVTLIPSMWNGNGEKFPQHGKGVIFVIEGARETRANMVGMALFPECLKSELREIRSTIEAYSREWEMGGAGEASACGLSLSGKGWVTRFRVRTKMALVEYRLDRWD